ncbi:MULTISPECIES: CueP family metal-binding protein [unclassified Ornithinimicrobium]|uniref:CueP family metal-binding protein n=1 Tax=unclassified Ornithinimicrobium TaxID=2615080 RepID=UPI003854F941
MRFRSVSPVPLALALTLALAACSGGEQDDPLLAELGLDGSSGQQIVEQLEASTDHRPLSIGASVREDHLVVTDGTDETTVPLPQDEFYVSIAPYMDQTHDCFYHSLGTCQGELVGEEVAVTITGADGTVLVDETVTTHTNGFTGFWLPRDVEGGTIEVVHGQHEGRVPFSTTEGSPTCITTLQLEPVGA